MRGDLIAAKNEISHIFYQIDVDKTQELTFTGIEKSLNLGILFSLTRIFNDCLGQNTATILIQHLDSIQILGSSKLYFISDFLISMIIRMEKVI